MGSTPPSQQQFHGPIRRLRISRHRLPILFTALDRTHQTPLQHLLSRLHQLRLTVQLLRPPRDINFGVEGPVEEHDLLGVMDVFVGRMREDQLKAGFVELPEARALEEFAASKRD